MINYNLALMTLASDVFQENLKAGWWDDWPKREDRINTAFMLIVTEFAEAAEGARKDLMDTHLTHHKMLHVEIADAAIRLLDLCGALNMRVTEVDQVVIDEIASWVSRQPNAVASLYLPCCLVCDASLSVEQRIESGLMACIAIANHYEFDLFSIINEKRVYNQHRADHKREARAAEGGKKI